MHDAVNAAQWRRNLEAERDAAALYLRLAAAEAQPALADVYRRLAATEQKHVTYWEGRFREAGLPAPTPRVSWRVHVMGWLAGRFGTAFVVPTLAGLEQNADASYRNSGDRVVEQMAGEERSHARMFSVLAGNTSGMEGRTVAKMEGRHRSTGGNALRAGVLGANDGLVSNFSLLMGVAGAEVAGGAGSRAVLITGAAGLLAGAISMALGEWLSVQSSRELYTRQMDVEKAELAENPEEEKEELALIYQAKGLPPEDARRLAERLLSDDAVALDTLVREELSIDPEELGGSAWEAAFSSFLLFAVGAVLPIIPFLFTSGWQGIVLSALFSAVGLFVIGAAITLVTGRSIWWSGFRQVIFGLVAAGITFAIGHLIGVQIAG
jgi:VIT1/CCC1 family predicted Fe2+/Mn2+ transporter